MLTRSDNIGAIAKAMAEAQAEIHNAVKDSTNPFYKSRYANLPTFLNVIRPVYSRHGIVITQIPAGVDENNKVTVETLFFHDSGEWLLGTITVPIAAGTKLDPQVIGSAISYACRYAIAPMALVAAQDELDDDGEASSGRNQDKGNSAPPPPPAEAPKPPKEKAKPKEKAPLWTDQDSIRFTNILAETKGYLFQMQMFDEAEELIVNATKAKDQYGPDKMIPHAEAKRDQAKKDVEEFLKRQGV